MKKIYLVGAMCAYLFAGCAGNASQAGHDEHNHELEAHDHDHDHEAEEAHDREQPSAHLFESWMLSNKTHLEELPGFSAVIVKPASVSSAYRLRQRFNEIDAAGHDGKIVPLMAAHRRRPPLYVCSRASSRSLRCFWRAFCSAA